MQPGRTVYLDGAPRKVLRARADRAAWILQLQGITDRDAAEACREYLIEAADDDVQRNDADSYFIHELVGLRVVTSDGRELGNLTEVIQSGAADVYVAEGPEGEVLFPAIAEVVEEINLREQFMRITPLPGLLDKSK
jgi:16S rRNA processing protein RimM